MKTVLEWFSLKNTPGIGNHLIKKLIDRFHSPEHISSASVEELTRIKGISHPIALAIKQKKITDPEKQELDAALKKGIRMITMADETYPPLLHHIPDPPPVLYVLGNLKKASINMAVVGSRNATRYGITTAKQLSRDLAHYGLSIVSGMARGIDAAAHTGALEVRNGHTVAVLGSGMDVIYPTENRSLFQKITESGAVITEFPLGTRPEPYHFPLRNRIICGMSVGTIVVEAAMKSGSLITAKLAADQGREVFAVPGSIRSNKSAGAHSLLKQGAKLVENADDIIEEILPFLQNVECNPEIPESRLQKKQPMLDSDETIVFKALESYPVHIDDIVRSTGVEPGKLAGILLKLELEGMATQLPGKYFSCCEESTCQNL
ncbi:MAG: DNA-processing protein DprA [Pseudomonadota bacterium]